MVRKILVGSKFLPGVLYRYLEKAVELGPNCTLTPTLHLERISSSAYSPIR